MAVDEARAARIRAYAERHPTDTGNIAAQALGCSVEVVKARRSRTQAHSRISNDAIELSRDGPRSRDSPRIRQRRRCKRIAEPNPRRSWEAVTPSRLDQQPAVLRGTESLLTLCWREMDSNLYGAFPVKRSFSIYCQFFVRSGKGPFFVPSPPIRFPERAMGSRDRNASKALAPWRLAALVFGSALTPEHAPGR